MVFHGFIVKLTKFVTQPRKGEDNTGVFDMWFAKGFIKKQVTIHYIVAFELTKKKLQKAETVEFTSHRFTTFGDSLFTSTQNTESAVSEQEQ